MRNGVQVRHLVSTDLGALYVTKGNDLGMEADGTFLEAGPERKFMKKHLKQGSVFIDVGAHVGFFSIAASQLGAKYVYSYEPHPENYSNLQYNFQLHKIPGRAWNIAVGDVDGYHLLYAAVNNNSGDHMLENCGPTQEPYSYVDVTSLDSVGLAPDFIKIDVQGYEYKVLKGAMNTIRRYQPVMMVEYSPFHLGIQGILGSHFLDYVYSRSHYKIECPWGDPYELESPAYTMLYMVPK